MMSHHEDYTVIQPSIHSGMAEMMAGFEEFKKQPGCPPSYKLVIHVNLFDISLYTP